jgi:GT2 family glycosyltransferase
VSTVAVVVLNWNGLEDTRALLPTLAACRLPEGWTLEVVVVDNGSSDGSAAALAAEFPGVTVLPLPENRRFAAGNNHGLRHALARGAEAVMLLNNDTRADPGLIERLLMALAEDPGAGAAGPLIYFGAPTRRIWYAGGSLDPWLGWASHRGVRALDHGQYRSLERTGYVTGCCLLAPRAAWERVGLLDERYYIYAEDSDWCLRARAAGFHLLFVPTARLWHEVSASSGQASPWKIYHRLRANWTLFATHARGLARLTWRPAFLAWQLALMGWLLLGGHAAAARAVPRAIGDAIAGKPPGEAMP